MCFIPTAMTNRTELTTRGAAEQSNYTVAQALDDAPTTDVAILNGRIRLNRIFNNIIITHDRGV